MDWLTGLKRESINRHAAEKQLDGFLVDKITTNQINVGHLKKQKTETGSISKSRQENTKEKSSTEILETLIKGFDKNPGKAINLLKTLFEAHPEIFDQQTSISLVNKVFDTLANLKQQEIIDAIKFFVAPILSHTKKLEQMDSSEGLEPVG